MLVEFECPHCQVRLRAGIDHIGSKANCPNCRKEFTVPEKEDVKKRQKKEI